MEYYADPHGDTGSDTSSVTPSDTHSQSLSDLELKTAPNRNLRGKSTPLADGPYSCRRREGKSPVREFEVLVSSPSPRGHGSDTDSYLEFSNVPFARASGSKRTRSPSPSPTPREAQRRRSTTPSASPVPVSSCGHAHGNGYDSDELRVTSGAAWARASSASARKWGRHRPRSPSPNPRTGRTGPAKRKREPSQCRFASNPSPEVVILSPKQSKQPTRGGPSQSGGA
jgi:hypothetical protein